MYLIFIIGTAGSGKSLITSAFSDWLKLKKQEVISVNLDPGVLSLPYTPDVDIREYISLDSLMDKYTLGPNGALIVAADLIATEIDIIRNEIEIFNADYVIIDTPGQIELFAYRSSGRLVSSVISDESQPASVFLIDPSLVLRPEGFSSVLLLSVSVAFQLSLPQIVAISKEDIIEKEQMNNLETWIDSPDSLVIDIQSGKQISMSQQLGVSIIEILDQFKTTGELIPISANTGYNIDTLIGLMEREWGERDDFYE